MKTIGTKGDKRSVDDCPPLGVGVWLGWDGKFYNKFSNDQK